MLFCEENELKSQLLMTIPLLEAEPTLSSFKTGKDLRENFPPGSCQVLTQIRTQGPDFF